LGLALIKLSGLPLLNHKRETSKLVFLVEHVSANSFLLGRELLSHCPNTTGNFVVFAGIIALERRRTHMLP
jgi:hypothetical protein